ncbi:hypothetical protein GPECTOR_1253g509 [Gonium pectorale]|uniref:F-box domain-containing protein n=1 Tax=Gonium pectorale TaxID=33097 RepID=A0A150FTJ7_GONPE|nr:hypothetical protein GPECTOR_1253g509 [Gonium pectorale]|eukprot:KXZ40934.1 hypothetical protein GPECTOR_1253g509 [Gonium pectorale]
MLAAPKQCEPDSALTSSRIWVHLPFELAERIVSFLEPNELPYFRLVNKAAATQFREPRHMTFRLSQPAPADAFAAHWLAPGATRGLTLNRRLQLLSLTAASGVVPNLEVAAQAAGCLLTYDVFQAAAAAGHLNSCQWLLEHGCPTKAQSSGSSGLLAAAAQGGHRHVCEWLLGLSLTWSSDGAVEAARGGHLGLMEWLLQRRPELSVRAPGPWFRETWHGVGVAEGCDLPTLQRLWRGWGELDAGSKEAVLAAAAASPTPDWAAKVEWLEAQGCPQTSYATATVLYCPDSVARLTWLRSRGYSLCNRAASLAAILKNMAALQFLVGEAGVSVGESDQDFIARNVCVDGDLEALQALHAAGWELRNSINAPRAAENGHLHVLTWLHETLGAEAVEIDALLLYSAARSGSVEAMAWLRERGCEWGYFCFSDAAYSGCEEAVEWLMAQGCRKEVRVRRAGATMAGRWAQTPCSRAAARSPGLRA